MNGQIFFNMLEQQHPVSGSSKYLLKRWRKHTIYAKSGSYVRAHHLKSGSYGWSGSVTNTANFPPDIAYNWTNNPTRDDYDESSPLSTNWYQTCSVYLYDYVVVNDTWFYQNVYTASTVDTTPNLEGDPMNPNYVPVNTWKHQQNTWKNSPDAITNNYIYAYNETLSTVYGHSYYGPDIIYRDDGTYFEIVRGYPRNHWTHKRHIFSLYNLKSVGRLIRSYTGTMAARAPGPENPENMDITRSLSTESGSYLRNRQTTTSTVGPDGLEDGTPPVQSVQVGNLKLVQTDNVINH